MELKRAATRSSLETRLLAPERFPGRDIGTLGATRSVTSIGRSATSVERPWLSCSGNLYVSQRERRRAATLLDRLERSAGLEYFGIGALLFC